MNQEEYVLLRCDRDKGKLRVKVETPGYIRGANCQFPRDIRKIGAKYLVPKHSVQLITTRGKYFYSINRAYYSQIEIVEQNEFQNIDLQQIASHIAHIYENEEETECVICMSNEKSAVFDPCCHFYVCYDCGTKISACPICRQQISNLIPQLREDGSRSRNARDRFDASRLLAPQHFHRHHRQ